MFSPWGSSKTSLTDGLTQSQNYRENENNCRQEDNLTPDNWYDIVLSDEEETSKNDNNSPTDDTKQQAIGNTWGHDTKQQAIGNTWGHEITISTTACDTDDINNMIHSAASTSPIHFDETTAALQKCEVYKQSTLQPPGRKLSIDEVIALIDRQEQRKQKSTKSHKVSKSISITNTISSTLPHSDAENTTEKNPAEKTTEKNPQEKTTEKKPPISTVQRPKTRTRKISPVLDLASCTNLKAEISGTHAFRHQTKEYSKCHLDIKCHLNRSFEGLNDSGVDVTILPGNKQNDPQHDMKNATLRETYTASDHIQRELLDLLNANSLYKYPSTCDAHVDNNWINPLNIKYPDKEMKLGASVLATDMCKADNSKGNFPATTNYLTQPSQGHAGFMSNGFYPSMYCPPEAYQFLNTQAKMYSVSSVNQSTQDSSVFKLEDEALEEILKRIPQIPSQGTKQKRKKSNLGQSAPSLSFFKRPVHCNKTKPTSVSESLSYYTSPELSSFLPHSHTIRRGYNLNTMNSEGPGSLLSNIEVQAAKRDTVFPTTTQEMAKNIFLSNQDAFLSNQDAFGSNQDAFGSNQDAFGSNQDAFGSQFQPFALKSLKYFKRKPTSQ